MNNHNIFITGGGGFIGSHLASELSAQTANIKILDNFAKGRHNLLNKKNISYHEKDLSVITDKELEEALSGVDVLYHLAAEKHSSHASADADRIFNVNINATYRLFTAAAKAGVKKIIFTSSLYAYGKKSLPLMSENDIPKPETVYGVSKLAGEHLLANIKNEYNIDYTVLRLFFVYGSGIMPYSKDFSMGYRSVILKNFERMLNNEKPVIYGNGMQALDYVHVSDVVKALILSMNKNADGKTINVSSGKYINILELTDLMKTISGYKDSPIFEASDITEGSIRAGDNSYAKNLLNWQPMATVESGLREVYNWMVDSN